MKIVLSDSQKRELIKLIGICEQGGCKNTTNLRVHRIKRGNSGGEYILRNCMVICGDCHKTIHFKEEGCRKK